MSQLTKFQTRSAEFIEALESCIDAAVEDVLEWARYAHDDDERESIKHRQREIKVARQAARQLRALFL